MSKVKCLKCNNVIESKSRHDFNVCGCKNYTAIDGGSHYLKISAVDLSLVFLIEDNLGKKVNKIVTKS